MKGYYFNAQPTDDAERYPSGFDREYDAMDSNACNAIFFENGVFANRDTDSCKVSGSGTVLTIHPGICLISGAQCHMEAGDSVKLTEGDGKYSIFCRMNTGADVRAFQLAAVQGEGFPAPVRAGDVYDMCLAHATLVSGVATVEDTRGDAAICGYAALAAMPPYYPPDEANLPYILWLYTLGFPMTPEQLAAVEGNPSMMAIYNGTKMSKEDMMRYIVLPSTMTEAEKKEVEADPEKMAVIRGSPLNPQIGDIKTCAYPVEDSHYLPCDGRIASPADYPELFAKMSYRYGNRPLTGKFYYAKDRPTLIFLATGKLSTAANAETGILSSSGSAYYWIKDSAPSVYTIQSFGSSLSSECVLTDGNGTWLAVYNKEAVRRSTDVTATSSFAATPLIPNDIADAIYYNGYFVIADYLPNTSTYRLHYSQNGLTWTTKSINFEVKKFRMIQGELYALELPNILHKTTNLTAWQSLPPITFFAQQTSYPCADWVYYKGSFIFIFYDNTPVTFVSTKDLISFTTYKFHHSESNSSCQLLVSGAYLFLCISGGGCNLLYSTDGVNFTSVPDSGTGVSRGLYGYCARDGKVYFSVSSRQSDYSSGIYRGIATDEFLLPNNTISHIKVK